MAMSPSILSLCLTYTSSIWPCAIFRIFCNYGIITTEISTSSNNNKNNNSNESTIKSRTEKATSLSHCWNLCCLHLWKLNWEQKKTAHCWKRSNVWGKSVKYYIHRWYVRLLFKTCETLAIFIIITHTQIQTFFLIHIREHESKIYVGIVFI